MADSVDHLLQAASRFPLLTPAQEIQLGRSIRAWQDWEGGPDAAPPGVRRRGKRALDKFVCANMRLAHFVAKRYRVSRVPMEDLLQAAIEGLITAAKRFKPELGYKFSSYATWYCLQASQAAVAQQGSCIRLPTTLSESIRRVFRHSEQLRSELNRAPTAAEIAERARLKPGQLDDVRRAAHAIDTLSLDMFLWSQGDGPSGARVGDQLSQQECEGGGPGVQDGGELEDLELRELLMSLVLDPAADTGLTPQQRFVIMSRYFHPGDRPPSLARLATQLNMCRESVRRMERQAIARLRELLPPEAAECL